MIIVSALSYLLIDLSVCVSGQSFVWGRDTKTPPEQGILPKVKPQPKPSSLAAYLRRNTIPPAANAGEGSAADVPNAAAVDVPSAAAVVVEEVRAEGEQTP